MRTRILLAAAAVALASCGKAPNSNDTVFVSNEAGNVAIVDGATGSIQGALKTGARPRGMELSPDGRTLYVAASNAGRIEAWDVHSHDRTELFNAGSDPERFAVSPDGKML